MRHNATKLLSDASDCGLRITGLDGWTQTRLAKTLQIRRETLNAIINRSPGTDPTNERPKLVEACRKLITFAAALSAKDDAVLKNPIDSANLLNDDGQAYEHHRLRLHRLVEGAVADNQFTDALCRMGEFASAAMHAPKPFRLRMICNLVTAIQRLLDKPASREVPAAVLRANLVRLYRAERSARRCGREGKGDHAITEQSDYVRGQAGYGLVFSGILLADPRLVQRGGRRLMRAVKVQPDASFGHWCNLLRATNDLMASSGQVSQEWARRILVLAAEPQGAGGFAASYSTLQAKDEVQELRAHWERGDDKLAIRRLVKNSKAAAAPCPPSRAIGAMIGMVMTLASLLGTSAFASGDGRDFKAPLTPQPVQPTAPVDPPRVRPETAGTRAVRTNAGSQAEGVIRGAGRHRPNDLESGFRIEIDPDFRNTESAIAADANAEATLIKFAQEAWGENIRSYGRVRGGKVIVVAPSPGGARTAVDPAPVKPVAAADPADKAARTLGMDRNYAAIEKFDVARQKLQEIVSTYPATPAAQEAKAMLVQLPGN